MLFFTQRPSLDIIHFCTSLAHNVRLVPEKYSNGFGPAPEAPIILLMRVHNQKHISIDFKKKRERVRLKNHIEFCISLPKYIMGEGFSKSD